MCAVRRRLGQMAYGYPDGASQSAPTPIITGRAPTTSDIAEIGTMWCDQSANTVYVLASITAGTPNWTTNPSAGIAAASMTINPGDVDILAGNLTVAGTSTLTGGVAMAAAATVGTTLTVGTDLAVGGASIFTGDVTINGDAVYNGAIAVTSGTGAIDISADATTTTVNLATGAGPKTLSLGSDNGASSTTVQTGTGAMTLTAGGILDANVVGAVTVDTAAGISLDGATASNFTVTGAADLTLSSTAGSVVVNAEEAVADAIQLTSAAGGVTVATGALGISLDATAGVVDINSTTGLVTMTPAVDAQAATTVTINANVGVGTFTGLTTAAAATEVLTVTNALCTATSAILCTVANLGAADAQMTITRVIPAAGSFTVSCLNNGAAALNGNIILTFWIIAA